MTESLKFKVRAEYLSEEQLVARENKLSQIEESLELLGQKKRWFLGRPMQASIDLVSEEINGEALEIVKRRVLEYLEGNEQWYNWLDRKVFRGYLRDPFGSQRYEVKVCMYYVAIEKFGLLKEQGGVLNEADYEKQKKDVHTVVALVKGNFQYKKSKEKEEAPKRARVIQILKSTEEWKSESDFWIPSKENRLKQVVWKYANYSAEASDGLSKDDSARYKDKALRRLTNAYERSSAEIPGFKIKILGVYIYRSKKYKAREANLKASYQKNQQIIASIYQDAKILLKEFGLRSLGVLECAKEAKQIDEELYSKLSEELSTWYLEALLQVKGNRDIEDILRLKYWWCSESLWKQYQSKRLLSSASKIEINIQQEWNEFNLDLNRVEEPLCKIQLPGLEEEKRCRVDQHALSQSMRGILRKSRKAFVSAHVDEETTTNMEESRERCERYKEWILKRYSSVDVNSAIVEEKSDVTRGVGQTHREALENICHETLGVLQQLSEWKKWLLTYEAKGKDILFTVKYYSQVTRSIKDGISTQCVGDIEEHEKTWSAYINSEEKKLLSTHVSLEPSKANDQSRNIVKGSFNLLRQILSLKTKRFNEQIEEYKNLALAESQQPATFEEEVFEAEMKRREVYIRKVVFEEGKQ
ncbi:MAG: hypothetical protein JSS53_05450, partial [Proteobacteria bacterium]|nr:hypothetical protein [Pseudomonadota bacterium]